MDEKVIQLLKTLPPLVACVIWDVVNENISLKTIEIADKVTEEEWKRYEIVRCIAAGNPQYPPVQEAQVLVEIMLEELVMPVA
ncbi:MAG: hypothetical protein L0332_22260 [Chloroflexi bacterium]|nr:hypothetical protein [Chloroflexota bacterium]MCI0578989.1 hypothetical protein [Chloroflexota bacterium]MCI0648983.1 hypothetical protein [Chloroflexota bacterium]MCI0729418.1 hypothetical protein [Chloroflexota bacterium]